MDREAWSPEGLLRATAPFWPVRPQVWLWSGLQVRARGLPREGMRPGWLVAPPLLFL